MLRYLLQRVSGSFWFLPTLMTVGAVGLALLMGWVEGADWSQDVRLWSDKLSLGAEGSRQVVSTVAGAMVTAASLVYSMTLVALTLAAQSAGQRLLQELMGNRAMQVSLGLFLSTFVYCLLVLRTIVGADGAPVPNLSVAAAVLLAIASLVWLIYFIHSLAGDIQTHSIVAVVTRQLTDALHREAAPKPAQSPEPVRCRAGTGFLVCTDRTGYLETLDEEAIVAAAERSNSQVRMAVRHGDFLSAGDPLAECWGGASDELEAAVRKATVIGPRRTAAGDPEYLVHLLVEIALRALSPGINDTYTAIACVDHLFGALATVLPRGLRSPVRCDGEGRTRLELYPTHVADLVEEAFDPIRQAAAGNLPVALRVLEVLDRMAARAGERRSRDAIVLEAELMAAVAVRHAETDHDRQAVARRLARVRETVDVDDRSATAAR